MTSYRIEFAPGPVRVFKKLPADVQKKVRRALEKLAADPASTGRIGGKTVKTLQGVGQPFHRLRVGDHRVMFDVLDEERVVLVLGIVERGDLERWIRNR